MEALGFLVAQAVGLCLQTGHPLNFALDRSSPGEKDAAATTQYSCLEIPGGAEEPGGTQFTQLQESDMTERLPHTQHAGSKSLLLPLGSDLPEARGWVPRPRPRTRAPGL